MHHDGCGAHNFSPASICPQCRKDRHRRAEENTPEARKARADRFQQALAEVRQAWREKGGDYYPLTQRIADEHEVDVWTLREEWLRPYHTARKEAAMTREP